MTAAKQPKIQSADVDAWAGAQGSIDGLPSLLRFRPGLAEHLGDERFSRRLQVTWTYRGDEGSGMPSDQESDQMRVLEDRLVASLEAEEAGVLAFVFTHGGTREWHIYVSDSAELSQLVNTALADLPGLPIDLAIEDDPEWDELANVLRSVRE